MDHRHEREAAGRQTHAAQDVETDPQSPGELVVQVGRPPQAVAHPQVSAVRSREHQNGEDAPPDGESREQAVHAFSFLATSSRRLVIHQIPPSNTLPTETTSGTRCNTRHVSAGSGSCGTRVLKPICSKGTAERYSTEVPPASRSP